MSAIAHPTSDPTPATRRDSQTPARPRSNRLRRRQQPNLLGALSGYIWLAIIILPIYYVLITSLRTQAGFFSGNPLAIPAHATLDNYRLVLQNDFTRYFLNSVIVTVATVAATVTVSFMAAFTIVRGTRRINRAVFTVFLLGLAIPIQATIVPIYYMITRAHLYDTLLALILPSIAFAIPLTVIILVNFLRDIPKELFESMRLDGASHWQTMWRLALPLVRPAVITVSIYDALNVWNAFLFPLILTQSPEQRVLPLALWSFQGQFTVNIPAVLAAVVLSTLPILALYIIGRRQLVAGLTAGFSK
jgi:raffinose/stachyose/melibiose transport system permease protein